MNEPEFCVDGWCLIVSIVHWFVHGLNRFLASPRRNTFRDSKSSTLDVCSCEWNVLCVDFCVILLAFVKRQSVKQHSIFSSYLKWKQGASIVLGQKWKQFVHLIFFFNFRFVSSNSIGNSTIVWRLLFRMAVHGGHDEVSDIDMARK